MYKYCVILAFVLLTGCVTTPYGNFIENPSKEVSAFMADDVVTQLLQLYLPASTQFNLRHAINDPFGVSLVGHLREEGYAVLELVKKEDAVQEHVASGTEAKTEAETGLSLGYIVDKSGDLYHVRIMIDDQRLTRVFVTQADAIHPAGHWVRKE